MSDQPALTPAELALLPHNSRGPALVSVSWVLVGLSTIFLGLRVYCKRLGRRGLWWDDWVLIAAWVLLVIDAALATHLVVNYTYGHHSWDLRPPDNDRFVLILAVRATLTVTAIAWTKTAFAITLLRVSAGWMKKVEWFVIISMNVLLGLTALFFWIHCTPVQKTWTPSFQGGSCWNTDIISNMGLVSSSYSSAMDFLLALLPWKLIWGLTMKKQEKFGIGIAMSMGFLAGIVAIVKTVNLPKLASNDMYDTVELVMWDITEGSVTLVAACIPVLRVLVRDIRNGSQRRYNYQITDAPLRSTAKSSTSAAALGGKYGFGDGGGGTTPPPRTPVEDSDHRGAEEVVGADDWSDRSFLDNPPPSAEAGALGSKTKNNRIVRTQEVTIEHHDRGSKDELYHSATYELRDLPRR